MGYYARDIHHSNRGKNGPIAVDYAARRKAEQDALTEDGERRWNRLVAERRAKVDRMLADGDLTEGEAETLRGYADGVGFDAILAPYEIRARKRKRGTR